MRKLLMGMFLFTGFCVVLMSAGEGYRGNLVGVFGVSVLGGGLMYGFFSSKVTEIKEKERKEAYIAELEAKLKGLGI